MVGKEKNGWTKRQQNKPVDGTEARIQATISASE
jgi:hypothetical protein